MKRLSKSVEAMDESESESELESVHVVSPSLARKPAKPRVDPTELPKSVLGYDLKSVKSFKVKRKALKFASQSQVFEQEVKEVLDQYAPNVDEFDLDRDLLLLVLNMSEEYFIHGADEVRNKQKKESIAAVMLPYFRNDKQILQIMIDSVWKKVKKSTYMKRKLTKLKQFFFA